MRIMFKIGAVNEGFRAVAAAIVAIAMPQAPDVKPADPEPAGTKDLPHLSQILGDAEDPMDLGDVDKHQHLRWNPMSINLPDTPPHTPVSAKSDPNPIHGGLHGPSGPDTPA